MKNSRLKQTLYYQLNTLGWSCLYVYGIAVVVIITIGLLVTTSANSENFIITGISAVGGIHLFIVGMAGIRSDLQFFLQHGISRRTTFFSNLYGSLICGAALGLFFELFDLIAFKWLSFATFSTTVTIQSFLSGWMLSAFALFFAWQLGALISLIYYRLSRMQQIVFSVGFITGVLFASSDTVRRLFGINVNLWDIMEEAFYSVFGRVPYIIWPLVLGIAAAAGNYLLIRRAQVK